MSKLIIEICQIDKVEHHSNADKLDIVTVKGWNCIVSRDQFKVGDLVVFCPPDSIIPNNLIEQYKLEFLKKNGRVDTVKLRGYISQGLILDLKCLIGKTGVYAREGMDVAEVLGITKYEPPEDNIQLQGKPTKRKRNPNFSVYTDIQNINNYNTVFKEEDYVVITEKIHGTNFRAGRLLIYTGSIWGKIKSWFCGKYEFVYGSHNVQMGVINNRKNFYGENVYGQIAKKYKLAEIIPEDYIIYGEIYGKKIQKLEYGMGNGIGMRIFDVKYKGNYLNQPDLERFCVQLKLQLVPILYVGKFSQEVLKKFTIGNTALCDNHIKEGCVVKSYIEENHPQIGRKILKSVNPEYLLLKDRTEYH